MRSINVSAAATVARKPSVRPYRLAATQKPQPKAIQVELRRRREAAKRREKLDPRPLR